MNKLYFKAENTLSESPVVRNSIFFACYFLFVQYADQLILTSLECMSIGSATSNMFFQYTTGSIKKRISLFTGTRPLVGLNTRQSLIN